jgi:hypothetical protein
MPLILVLLPHCDDEVFLSRFIPMWKEKGCQVKFVFLTKDLKIEEERRNESRRYLQSLGVLSADMHFLSSETEVPVGRLPDNILPVFTALKGELERSSLSLSLIVSTAYEGGHQDHDATYVIAEKLLEHHPSARHFVYYTYSARDLPRPWFRVNAPIRDQVCALEALARGWLGAAYDVFQAFRFFPSQTKTWMGLGGVYLICFWRDFSQALYETQRGLIRSRPHSGDLLYERRFGYSYETFHKHVLSFLDGVPQK